MEQHVEFFKYGVKIESSYFAAGTKRSTPLYLPVQAINRNHSPFFLILIGILILND